MELPDFVDIEAKQGDTFILPYIVYDDDGATPIDITGYSVEFSMAVAPGSSPDFTYTDTDGYITVGTTDGVINIEIPYALTKLWVNRRYHYEVTATTPAGVRETHFEGRIRVRPEVVDG